MFYQNKRSNDRNTKRGEYAEWSDKLSREKEVRRMISYLQLERTTDGVVDINDSVVFDRIVSNGGNRIGYDTGTGEIIIGDSGYYYVEWFVATQFGLTTNGSNFAIVISDTGLEMIGSSHVKVSPTIGFAIIETTAPNMVIKLINASDNSLTLSQAVNAKAALAIFTLAGATEVLE